MPLPSKIEILSPADVDGTLNRGFNDMANAMLREGAVTAYDQLKPTQQRWVDYYIQTDNPVEAWLLIFPHMRGSSAVFPRVHELCRNPLVKAAVVERTKLLTDASAITAERVLKEIASLAYSNMKNYTVVNDDGEPVLGDWSQLTDEQWAAIAEITTEEYVEGKGDNARPVKRTKYKLYDKGQALDKLARHLGLYAADNDRALKVSAPDGGPVKVFGVTTAVSVAMTPEQAADYYAKHLEGDQS